MRNPRLFGVLAFLVAGGLVAGATVAFVNSGDEDTTKAASPIAGATASPTASATPDPTPEPTVAPTPTPSASAAPSPSTTASASPSASVSASASAGTGKTFAYPKPSRTYDGLRATATINPGGGNTGTTFDLTVKGTDGDGEIYFAGLTWGDGSSVPAEASPQQCKTYPPLTSPPGAYQPSPDSASYTKSHRFARPGTYTVTVQIASVNKDCKPGGPASERSDLPSFRVTVVAAPSPSPSAAASASPTSSPS